MTLFATKLPQQRPFLPDTALPTVPKLPTTSRLFSVHKKRPSLAIIALNRMGFGPGPGDVAQFNALGKTDSGRLSAYVAQQLNPTDIDDTDFEARLAAAHYTTLNKSRSQLLAEQDQPRQSYAQQGLRELERLIFLRAIYSNRQLLELLADFWHNYFNIYAWQSPQMASTFIVFDGEVIRANLLGNFIQMMSAVADSPEWRENAQLAPHSNIPKQQPLEEIAYRVCLKLCRRLISDFPPSPIVQSTTALFLQTVHAHDQLKQVVQHILLSKAFQTTWGEKVKRPFEAIASTLRATQANFTIRPHDADSDSFMWRYSQIGQAPFACREPDGYPDVKSHWQNSTSMMMRWRMVNWLFDLRDDNGRYRITLQNQMPPESLPSATTLVDYWIDRLLGYSMTPRDRHLLITFLANDAPAEQPLNMKRPFNQDRLRETVALMLNSPQFQQR